MPSPCWPAARRPRPHAPVGLLVFAVLACACGGSTPPPAPAAPAPREATEVAATMGRTWDAVIDMFAARNIPIRTIERASGIIATDELSVGSEGERWAVCGEGNGATLAPNLAIYNVLVRGDSASSRVMATVRWTLGSATSDIECTSTRIWERELERAVKARAESAQERAPVVVPASPVESSPPTFTTAAGAAPAPPDTGPPLTPAESRKARGLRSGVELLSEATFATAVSDLQAIEALQGFGETGKDTLTVELTAEGMRSLAIQHYLRRLFYAYRYANALRHDTLLLLTHGGRMIGSYTETGLEKRDWR
jgi:hypothetical protein